MDVAATNVKSSNAAEAMRKAIGEDKVKTDPQTLADYAIDVFWEPGILPGLVALPENEDNVRAVLRVAREARLPVVPRGAGLSYSKGCLPAVAGSIVIDMSRMNRIVEINERDLYVTVEAGVTWAALDRALQPYGLRPGFWGPLSGLHATVGGALSQTAAFFGSAREGTDMESVLGLTVALATGSVVTTGSASRFDTKPFTREGGPDLAGIFLGDNGAFGIKLSATLRLKPRPAEIACLSFGFSSMRDMAATQVELARDRLVSEGFGIDRAKAAQSASVNRLSEGAATLGRIMRSGKSMLAGLKDAATVAAAGTSFLLQHEFTLHLVLEAASKAEIDTNMAKVRAAAARCNGVEIESSVPRVLRSNPFGPLKGMTGRNGERWVPMNVVFPLGDALPVVDAAEKFFEERCDLIEQHGILVSVMAMTCGSEFFYAPAFYWSDSLTSLHARVLGEDVVGPWRGHETNTANRNAVVGLRRECQEMFASMGGIGWQVGRDVPYRERMRPESWELLATIKRALDPDGLMNPGALGLDPPSADRRMATRLDLT